MYANQETMTLQMANARTLLTLEAGATKQIDAMSEQIKTLRAENAALKKRLERLDEPSVEEREPSASGDDIKERCATQDAAEEGAVSASD